MVRTGLDLIAADPPADFAGVRAGLLCNQATVDRTFRHGRDIVGRICELKCLFSPQHGFFSEKQDNMIESPHGKDAVGLPVYSLYGESRRPAVEMFADLELLIIDLQDVGTRVYTFFSTVVYCLEEAARAGVRVAILDRPNPVGGRIVEGNVLDPEMSSFVGIFPMPMRHGMTMGELALMVNREAGIGADLSVIAMQGWERAMSFDDTGLTWVFPSPNLPSSKSAMVYPGQVIWEGTNVSEGRGTTLPFELFGAPFLLQDPIIAALDKEALTGCHLRPISFEPQSGKWTGELCRGFHILVTEAESFRPYRLSLALLSATARLCPGLALKPPPYEYEFEKMPLDLIIGDRQVREAILSGGDVLELERSWQPDLEEFLAMRESYLLY